MTHDQTQELAEAQRLADWLKDELTRQRAANSELRRAVADMARAFQETLARANDAAEQGDIELVKRITYENRRAWQQYLQQIVAAASTKPKPDSDDTV
ncbi:MAG: DUF2203 domain-containing protein [Chloroflexi bacterium AL-W]|nr:DUF2203 domain-containing protein [Chloroflexi bacterium AL-N1]NOK69008.1 DUF2203 domain-containing protein [Chloroflexi bacterium AL-N10]NOK76991.1 DUF2203 domain-containing protein [Chloroflexi bacterium AL-N5]NOK82621.1 DUF2203 domain-containing protein [Chloroflexi bacterium AL-W]NOK90848.1 DUF2203 domain-containing protein [Chloroflexi bacterium AL-N15]